MSHITISFLRHGKVTSYTKDMPLSGDAQADIDAAVPRLRALGGGDARYIFLGTRTNRSRDTAEALRRAIDPAAPDVRAVWGLRNPDLYLAGSRVEMGSSAAFFASQSDVLEIEPDAVTAHPFFDGFITSSDRIGYWLRHDAPPGEAAADVARRLLHFARSFAGHSDKPLVVACVTHSPILRAMVVHGLGLDDPKEPDWLEAVNFRLEGEQLSFEFRGVTGIL